MTDAEWNQLLRVLRGEEVRPRPVGFIIDCPWLPNWCGMSILDYFTNDTLWLEANMKAIREFPDAMFLPGFWSEYGMCTEPSAFGARCTFPANDFPHAHKVIASSAEIAELPVPNPKTDGLLPFVLNRLKHARREIERSGHRIRFAVARGPLNIATFLMGATEFLTMMMEEPENAHALLGKITRFLKDWIHLQRETFPTIDGILLLDDIIGFIGEEEFRAFGLPYFRELYSQDVSVKFLHNDAPSAVSAPYLPEMGVNLFNMGIDVTLGQIRDCTKDRVALLGNLPPRDVLASASAEAVAQATRAMLEADPRSSRRLIASCGGGMPPGVTTENIRAFIDAARSV